MIAEGRQYIRTRRGGGNFSKKHFFFKCCILCIPGDYECKPEEKVIRKKVKFGIFMKLTFLA